MSIEELYKLKGNIKKELKPIVDELILLREHRERLENENHDLKIRVVTLTEHIRDLNHALHIIEVLHENN